MANRAVAGLFTLIFFFSVSAFAVAQSKSESTAGTDIGWTSYVQVAGSANSDGQIFELNSNVGYTFTKYFGMDFAPPVYFANASSSSIGSVSGSGIDDPYFALRWKVLSPAVNYISVLTGSVPPGDSKRGLSTGRATLDWTNHFDRSFGRVTPFIEAAISNTTFDAQPVPSPRYHVGNECALSRQRLEPNYWRSICSLVLLSQRLC